MEESGSSKVNKINATTSKNKSKKSSSSNTSGDNPKTIRTLLLGFILGWVVSGVIVLNLKFAAFESPIRHHSNQIKTGWNVQNNANDDDAVSNALIKNEKSKVRHSNDTVPNHIDGLKILVAVVAYDFSQLPHLEEVLDSYYDTCVAGADTMDIVIYATVAYPITLIDLWNSRYFDYNNKGNLNFCNHFTITVALQDSSLRLHLVDLHRTLFYEKIDDYDLFIYTEDDMRVSPNLIATYMKETKRIETILNIEQQQQQQQQFKPSDFNVGIVRYEYNYPSNAIIDDKTRHATQNVTRVYWEHSQYTPPEDQVVGNTVELVPQGVLGNTKYRYIRMKNHHQGMFLATRQLLIDWKTRNGDKCRFHEIRDRPGRGSQPSEGTQRVWMSSHMLYGGRHCNVTQILPMDNMNALTVFHLPNKNYRRVGKYRNRQFSDGTEKFEVPPKLLSAMELHLEIRKAWPMEPQYPYRGVTMVDEITNNRYRDELFTRRMKEYEEYVNNGGVLSFTESTKLLLSETLSETK